MILTGSNYLFHIAHPPPPPSTLFHVILIIFQYGRIEVLPELVLGPEPFLLFVF